MKNYKKFLVGSLLLAMSLTSCGKSEYHGSYAFQMGKKGTAKVGSTMDLTQEKITVKVDEKDQQFEKFDITLEVPEDAEGGDDITSTIFDLFGDNGLSGGYKIDYDDEMPDPKINLYPVIEIPGDILNGGGEEGEGEGSSSSDPESSSSSVTPLVIDSRFIDDIMIAVIKGKTINVTVPVSLNDLMFQLYWYGFDLFDPLELKPLEKHDHGTHPTKEEIDKINETYTAEHFDLDAFFKYQVVREIKYRDYYTLTMGLAKVDK